jgi:hypothetical protein
MPKLVSSLPLSPTKRAGRYRMYIQLGISAAIVMCATATALAENVSDPKVQGALALRVKVALPQGWSISQKQSGVIPPDWYSEDNHAGFLVEANHGPDATLRVYFLPSDWIGIRKVQNNAIKVYWEGILGNAEYKTIMALKGKGVTDQYNFMDKFDHQLNYNLATPSLINSGYDLAKQIFKGKIDKADRAAQSLVSKYCTNSADLREAAHSLIVLGIPAKSVILRAAREARTDSSSDFTSALGYLGGADAIATLCDVVKDPQQSDSSRKYAAMALDVAAINQPDKQIGPALTVACQQVKDADALSGIVRALAHTRYKPAGPALLDAFNRISNDYYKLEIAQALASLRYQPALAELKNFQKRFDQNQASSGKMATISQLPGADPVSAMRLAILRFDGDWGKPSKNMRLMLVPPKDAVVGKKIEIRFYIENIGNGSFESWNGPQEGLTIDGKQIETGFQEEGITYNIRPGDVHCLWFDASPYIKKPGEYKLQYSVRGAVSNCATLIVR